MIVGANFFSWSFIFANENSLTYTRPWRLPDSAWDRRLLRNYPLYLVEGKGGLRVLLGETEADIVRRNGAPIRRDYFSPETLSYEMPEAAGDFVLYRGKIILIRIKPHKRPTKGVVIRTATGLASEDLVGKTETEMVKRILFHYGNPRHLYFGHVLNIYSRGIKFRFRKNQIIAMEIFHPRRSP